MIGFAKVVQPNDSSPSTAAEASATRLMNMEAGLLSLSEAFRQIILTAPALVNNLFPGKLSLQGCKQGRAHFRERPRPVSGLEIIFYAGRDTLHKAASPGARG
jgi:hypothetical protein